MCSARSGMGLVDGGMGLVDSGIGRWKGLFTPSRRRKKKLVNPEFDTVMNKKRFRKYLGGK